jgi:hypothetical protein
MDRKWNQTFIFANGGFNSSGVFFFETEYCPGSSLFVPDHQVKRTRKGDLILASPNHQPFQDRLHLYTLHGIASSIPPAPKKSHHKAMHRSCHGRRQYSGGHGLWGWPSGGLRERQLVKDVQKNMALGRWQVLGNRYVPWLVNVGELYTVVVFTTITRLFECGSKNKTYTVSFGC